MRTATVEILSDATNAAVLRHPDRKFPGVLVQGDTLHSLCVTADASCRAAKPQPGNDAYEELNDLRNRLWSLLNHYKSVLHDHQLPLPFAEGRDA
jgi:hypothetical protein